MIRPPIIWGAGLTALVLGSSLSFMVGGVPKTLIVTGTADPTAVATCGNIGAMYVKSGGSPTTPTVYWHATDACDTVWTQMVDLSSTQVLTGKNLISPTNNWLINQNVNWFFEEFWNPGGTLTTGTFGRAHWTVTCTGTGAAVTGSTTLSQATNPGLVQLSTGTTTTGSCNLSLSVDNFLFGAGTTDLEIGLYLPALSTVSQEYSVVCGWINTSATAAVVDGVFWKYARGTSVNWITTNENNSVTTGTAVTSTTAVVAGSLVKLKASIDATGATSTFSVDGVDSGSGTLTGNIPTSVGRETGLGCYILKSAGTVAATMLVDYVYYLTKLTSIR